MLDCRYYDLCTFTDDSCNGEPECPKRGCCQFYSPMPDVKALNGLAYKLRDAGKVCHFGDRYEIDEAFKLVSKRIREAIGADDDD